ncbi:MAG: lecithin retinol acyltransferase family protein [Moraxellaceae bacterium]
MSFIGKNPFGSERLADELVKSLQSVYKKTVDQNGSGSNSTSKKKKSSSINNFVTKRRIKNGDIIGVSRGHFDHYGIYVTGRSVIHYTSDGSDTSSSDNKIQETSFERFLRGSEEYFIIDLEGLNDFFRTVLSGQYPLRPQNFLVKRHFMGAEIVQRARSKIGEKEYDLFLNNCEHFAFWCATDIKDSSQITSYTSRFLATNRIYKKV